LLVQKIIHIFAPKTKRDASWRRQPSTHKSLKKPYRIGRLTILTAWKNIIFPLKKAMWNFIEKA